ncbi:hypothetical protein ACJZ2D_002173 [Fusarium nematophilum]
MRQASAALAILLGISRAAAQDALFTVRTVTITECFEHTSLPSAFFVDGPTRIVDKLTVTGAATVVHVQAPSCDCGCSTCVHTVDYTTTYEALCHTGLCERVYVVAETYRGMPVKPVVTSTDIPLGFTREVQTCTVCGPKPITATFTCPDTAYKYVDGVLNPTVAPSDGNSKIGATGVNKPAKPSEGRVADESEDTSDTDSGTLLKIMRLARILTEE